MGANRVSWKSTGAIAPTLTESPQSESVLQIRGPSVPLMKRNLAELYGFFAPRVAAKMPKMNQQKGLVQMHSLFIFILKVCSSKWITETTMVPDGIGKLFKCALKRDFLFIMYPWQLARLSLDFGSTLKWQPVFRNRLSTLHRTTYPRLPNKRTSLN